MIVSFFDSFTFITNRVSSVSQNLVASAEQEMQSPFRIRPSNALLWELVHDDFVLSPIIYSLFLLLHKSHEDMQAFAVDVIKCQAFMTNPAPKILHHTHAWFSLRLSWCINDDAFSLFCQVSLDLWQEIPCWRKYHIFGQELPSQVLFQFVALSIGWWSMISPHFCLPQLTNWPNVPLVYDYGAALIQICDVLLSCIIMFNYRH